MTGGLSGALLFTVEIDNNGASYVARKPGAFGGPIDAKKLAYDLERMRIAAELGVGPRFIAGDPATGVSIMEKIAGTPITRGTPRDTDPLGRLARTLRTLHGGPTMPGDELLGPFYKFLSQLDYEPAAIAAVEAASAELASVPHVTCHRDLNPMNLLATADRVYLIDWETAGPADPLFDLAVATMWMVRDAEQESFLASYFERAPDAAELRRLAVNRVVALGFYGAGFSLVAKMQTQPVAQDGPTLNELFARMAGGGPRFTPAEMASAMVRQAVHEAKAAGLLS
jgi:aminoglycoside phosphotransferase (APT) family kinase protein